MRLTLYLLLAIFPALAHATPIQLRTDLIVVVPGEHDVEAGDVITGSFFFDRQGTVHLNRLLDFPGREMGYTIASPTQAGGIRVEFDDYAIAGSPNVKIEVRDYDPARSELPDQLTFRADRSFGEVALTFRGAHASFFESTNFPISLPFFGAELPFLAYSGGEMVVRDRRGIVRFLAYLIPGTVRFFSLLERGPITSATDPLPPLVPVPEPGTALLLALGILGLARLEFRR